jgi:hypothetical protein
MSSKHTPGPWQISRDGLTIFAGTAGAGVLIRGVEQRIPHIAYIPKNGFAATLAEQQANARLIIAAPDLLAACERLLNTVGCDDWSAQEAARDAIAKAEGP